MSVAPAASASIVQLKRSRPSFPHTHTLATPPRLSIIQNSIIAFVPVLAHVVERVLKLWVRKRRLSVRIGRKASRRVVHKRLRRHLQALRAQQRELRTGVGARGALRGGVVETKSEVSKSSSHGSSWTSSSSYCRLLATWSSPVGCSGLTSRAGSDGSIELYSYRLESTVSCRGATSGL